MKFKTLNVKTLNRNNVNRTTINNLKNKLLGKTIKLKTLLKDVFQKEKPTEIEKQYISRGLPNSVGCEKDIYGGKSGKKMLHEGDKFQHEYLQTREMPNCISTGDDVIGVKLKKVTYFPEDIAKMEKMSAKERKEYKKVLKQEGKYYYNKDDMYTVTEKKEIIISNIL